MAKRRKTVVAHDTTVERNDKGISAAGESIGALVLFGLIVIGLLTWVAYSITTFLYGAAADLLGRQGANLLILAVPGALVVILIYGLAGKVGAWVEIAWADAQQARLQAGYVQVNEDGLLPVAKAFVDSAAGNAAAVQLALAHQRAQWTVGDVPQALTYSPKYSNRQEGATVGESQPAQLATLPTQGFYQLYSAGQLPDHGFLMGYNLSDGQAITTDWGKLYSALIGGLSGSGKSTLIRSILAQSALQGGRFIVLDPHYGAGEESLGASLQPLRHLMLTDVAANDRQMIDTLALVRDIGQRRLTGRDKDKSPVVLVVDEVTALLQRSAAAEPLTDALGEISQETRKVGVYGLCIGQNFDGRIMDTTIRNSFVSYVSCRARRDVARTMTGNPEFGRAAAQLHIGQAIWMTPQGEQYTLQVPNCTAQDLAMVAQHTITGGTGEFTVSGPSTTGKMLLPANFPPPSVATSAAADDDTGKWLGSAGEAVTDAQAQRILTMHADGLSMHKMIQAVFNVSGGRRYQDGRRMIESIIGKDQTRE